MRGLVIALLSIPLIVPSVIASAEVRTFRGEVAECDLPFSSCKTSHDATAMFSCKNANPQGNSCILDLNIAAEHEGRAPLTAKLLRTFGRTASGDVSGLACSARTTQAVVSCQGFASHPISLPVATCVRYEIVAEALEQPVSLPNTPVASVGFTQVSSSVVQVCRTGTGTPYFRDA